mmetsp:Transcript_9306/g.22892  ORF Transcript_9306/g.22892 Transcript_9306/m.22892 type:complete len:210 (+) Transcript_9306:219-848(+)
MCPERFVLGHCAPLPRVDAIRWHGLHLVQNLHPALHVPENHVFSVHHRDGLHRYYKLRAVCVSGRIAHGQQPLAHVAQLQAVRLVAKLPHRVLRINALATRAVSSFEVTALEAELLDDAMNLRAAVCQGQPGVSAIAHVTLAQVHEVVGGARGEVRVQDERDAAEIRVADAEVQKAALVAFLGDVEPQHLLLAHHLLRHGGGAREVRGT